MKKINWYMVVGVSVIVLVLFQITACSTVAGMGQDIKGAAEWTHDKMTKPQPADTPKQDPAK
jgi:predicted small secreted protein